MESQRIPGEHSGLSWHPLVSRLVSRRLGGGEGGSPHHHLAEVPGGVGVGAGGEPRWHHDGRGSGTGEILVSDQLSVISLHRLLQTVNWSRGTSSSGHLFVGHHLSFQLSIELRYRI